VTNPSTSAEQIIRQAKDLGCEIPRSDSRVLIVKLAVARYLTVKFDRSGRIREAAYTNADGLPRGIRPARVGAVLGVLFSEVYDTVHSPTEETPVTQLNPAGMLTPKGLREIGENALKSMPLAGDDRENTQRRIDHVATRILHEFAEYRPTASVPVRYRPELIAFGRQYNPHVTGNAEAAQVLAREAIRLAINARLAAITAQSFGVELTHDEAVAIEADEMMTEPAVSQSDSCEVGPMSVDIHGPWDRPVFEVGRWDNEEGAFEHVVSLSREEADALHTALGRTLLG
jgi:hypothetical protein